MYFFFGRFAGMGCTFFSGVRRNGMYFFSGVLRAEIPAFAGMVNFIFAAFRIRKRRGRSWGNIIPMKIGIFDSLEWNLRFAGMESSIRWNGIFDSLE